MARRLPMTIQIAVFVLLVAGSIAVWMHRTHVQNALAALSTGEQAAERGTRGGGGRGQRGERAVPVIVERVAVREDNAIVTAVGTARAKRAVMLLSKGDGQIVSLPIRAGQQVTAGQPLFTVDDTKAQLAVQIAEKQLEDARRTLERSRYLQERNVNSGAPVEDAESAVRRATLEVEQAKELLQDLTVRAPFDGVLGIPKVEVGDQVNTSTQVVSIDDRGELIIEFEVPERFLPRVDVGDSITVMTPSYRDRQFGGSISSIDSRVDPVSRTLMVRGTVPNPADLLRPGMSFTVMLTLPGASYPAVPELALQWQGSESHIWLVKDEAAQKVLVTPVRRLNQDILVTGDVQLDDLVVVEGLQRLRPGRAVVFYRSEVGEQPGSATRKSQEREARVESGDTETRPPGP